MLVPRRFLPQHEDWRGPCEAAFAPAGPAGLAPGFAPDDVPAPPRDPAHGFAPGASPDSAVLPLEEDILQVGPWVYRS